MEIKREGDNDSTEFPQADKPTAGMFCFCSAHYEIQFIATDVSWCFLSGTRVICPKWLNSLRCRLSGRHLYPKEFCDVGSRSVQQFLLRLPICNLHNTLFVKSADYCVGHMGDLCKSG